MEVDVALEKCRADAEAEPGGEVLGEAVDGVKRGGVAFAQQRVVALDDFSFGVAVMDGSNVRIVQPQVVEGGAEVGEEFAGMGAVQFAHGGGEERDVAEGIPAAEDELPFSRMWMGNERRLRAACGGALFIASGGAFSGLQRHLEGLHALTSPGKPNRAARIEIPSTCIRCEMIPCPKSRAPPTNTQPKWSTLFRRSCRDTSIECPQACRLISRLLKIEILSRCLALAPALFARAFGNESMSGTTGKIRQALKLSHGR